MSKNLQLILILIFIKVKINKIIKISELISSSRINHLKDKSNKLIIQRLMLINAFNLNLVILFNWNKYIEILQIIHLSTTEEEDLLILMIILLIIIIKKAIIIQPLHHLLERRRKTNQKKIYSKSLKLTLTIALKNRERERVILQ